MERIARRFVVLVACLVLVLLLAQGLGAQWRAGARTGRVSYLYDLERKIYQLTNAVFRRFPLHC